jgi:hypothetical protein
MKKGKFFIIEVPVWNIDFYCSVGQTDKEFEKSLKKVVSNSAPVHWEMPDRCAAKVILDTHGDPFCIRLRSTKSVFNKGSVTHEVVHAVSRILRNRGVVLCDESEEAFTFLAGYITREIYKRI